MFAPDWPGYGESDKPAVEYTTEFFIDFLGSLMDALGLEKAGLVGLSMGGAVALGFTLRFPARVEKLVLVCSYGLGHEVPWRVQAFLASRLPFCGKAAWWGLSRSRPLVRWSRRLAVYDSRSITEGLVTEIQQTAKRPGPERAFFSWLRSEVRWNGLRTDFAGRLREVAVPTLVLHGREDPLIPVSHAQRAHVLIKGSALYVLEKCGHLPPRERPEEFNRTVLEFLARNCPGGS